MPRVILVPGVGLFGAGATAADARIAADIAETTIAVILDAEAGGGFESIAERDQFDMEYWSLEQAKLGKRAEKPLQGQVVVVSGGAGTIGLATAAAFRREGAEVALLDLAAGRVKAAAKKRGRAGSCLRRHRPRDRSPPPSTAIVATFGGVDIVRVQCRRRLAGPHRRGRRRNPAPELRAQFLRPAECRAGRGAD